MAERSDFNDLHVAEGLAAVKAQLLAATEPYRDEALARDDDIACADQEVPLQHMLDSSLEWQAGFVRNYNGSVKADIANLDLVLRHDARWEGVLGYCDFSYRIVKRRLPPFDSAKAGEWSEADSARLRIWVSREYGFTPRESDALNAVLVASQYNRFHPVQEYLRGLQWDHEARLHCWLHHYMGADIEGERGRYNALVGTMWLIGGVARVMRPPVKVDTVLILEGLQGLGKSTALGILAGDWFTDSTVAIGEKDGYQQMQGVWIIELAELDSWHRAESKRNKQFFSSKTDRYRPSYGRIAEEFPRQCIFAGSTNEESYFKDSSGNRRYWPVRCKALNAEALSRDRDQLWAEAYHRFMEGETWWPDKQHDALFASEQEQRFNVDVWEEKFVDWSLSTAKKEVTMAQVFEDCLGMTFRDMKPPEQIRLGNVLSHLGWTKHRLRLDGGGRQHVYRAPAGWLQSLIEE